MTSKQGKIILCLEGVLNKSLSELKRHFVLAFDIVFVVVDQLRSNYEIRWQKGGLFCVWKI